MSTYLLLRSNKETGPYSLNELLEMGFKPYDLVWVTGKSAAWRYPGEIEELKSFAPVIEEQPYDRFYKKSAPIESQNLIKDEENYPGMKPIENVQQKNTPQNQESNVPSTLGSKVKKQVYVSLPVTQPVKKVEAPKPVQPVQNTIPDYEKQVSPDYKNYMPSQKSISETEKIVRLEKRFSQPLEEIKDMYVQTLVDRKKKMARNNFFRKNAKNVAIIFLILVLGALMGFAIQNFNAKHEPLAAFNARHEQKTDETQVNAQQQQVSAQQTVVEEKDIPVTTNDVPDKLLVRDDSKIAKPKQLNSSPAEQQSKINQNDVIETPTQKDQSAQKEVIKKTEDIIINETPPSVDKDPVTGERKKVVRAEKEPENNTPTRSELPGNGLKENIWKLVTLKTSNYITGPFGGIKDLRLTVANNSNYPVDKVEVEVKYIGMEQQIIKTQTMVFNDIAPGGKVQSEVPRTNRGMSVECTIKKINSRELGMAKSDY